MNTRQITDIDEFVRKFRDHPRERAALIGRLIGENSIITLNIPRIGPARLISERLSEGPFSDFYEFEKILARSLHPFLAGLNLNVIADVQVNALFERKYRQYTKRFQKVIAANRVLTQAALKDLILDMITSDGRYMVVKFYDLVIRPFDPALFRKVKPVELAVMEMINGLGGNTAHNEEIVRGIYRAFKKKHGARAAGLLVDRIAWDGDLGRYVPQQGEDEHEDIMPQSPDVADEGPAEPDEGIEDEIPFEEEPHLDHDASFGQETVTEEAPAPDDAILLEEIAAQERETVRDQAGQGPEEAEPEEAEPEETEQYEEETIHKRRAASAAARPSGAGMGRISRYAEILKNDFLLLKRSDDEEGIREIVHGIYAKNEMRFGADRAAEIVHTVLSIWIKDEMLNGWMRGILSDILDERSGTSTVHDEPGGFVPMEDETAPEPETADEGDGAGADDVIGPGSKAVDAGESVATDDGIAVDDSVIMNDTIEPEPDPAKDDERLQENDGSSMEEPAEDLPDTSEEELRALLSGTGDAPSDKETVPENEATSDQPEREEIDRIAAEDILPVVDVSGVEDAGGEEFLISEEEYRELTKPVGVSGEEKAGEEGFLVNEDREMPVNLDDSGQENIDLKFEAGEPAGKRFAARSTAGTEPAEDVPPSDDDVAGADSFVVKDEILFEDRSLKRKKEKDDRS